MLRGINSDEKRHRPVGKRQNWRVGEHSFKKLECSLLFFFPVAFQGLEFSQRFQGGSNERIFGNVIPQVVSDTQKVFQLLTSGRNQHRRNEDEFLGVSSTLMLTNDMAKCTNACVAEKAFFRV